MSSQVAFEPFTEKEKWEHRRRCPQVVFRFPNVIFRDQCEFFFFWAPQWPWRELKQLWSRCIIWDEHFLQKTKKHQSKLVPHLHVDTTTNWVFGTVHSQAGSLLKENTTQPDLILLRGRYQVICWYLCYTCQVPSQGNSGLFDTRSHAVFALWNGERLIKRNEVAENDSRTRCHKVAFHWVTFYVL